jgi:hypothetical protein
MQKYKFHKIDLLIAFGFLINLSLGIFYYTKTGFMSSLNSFTNAAWTVLLFVMIQTIRSLTEKLEKKNSEVLKANEEISKMLDDVQEFKRSMRI